MPDYKNIKGWASILGIPVSIIVVLFVLYMTIFHLEKLEYFSSRVYRLICFLGTKFKKKAISKEYRARILKATKYISGEIPEILPYDLEIKWVQNIDRETFLKNGKVIVRLNETEDKTQGIVMALQQYVEKGFIPKARKNVHPVLIRSLDKYMVRKMLAMCYKQGVNYFDEKVIIPLQLFDEESWEMLKFIETIDESGLLIQVLIREILEKSLRIDSKIPDPSLKAETRELISYLRNIITKERGEEVNLVFTGVHFKIAVIIIGKHETMNFRSQSYYNQGFKQIQAGCETIYILSDSRSKAIFANEIAEMLKEKNIQIIGKSTYRYKRKNSEGTFSGTCIALYTNCGAEHEVAELCKML